jgi:uncharacterized protein (DUF3084 family)
LSIFDQSKYTTNIHILNINEEDFPEKFHPIIRRLKKAVSDPEVVEQMENEDYYIKQMYDFLEKGTRELRAENAVQAETIAVQAETIAEKDNTIAEKDNAIAAQAARITELERLLSNNK